MADTETPRQPMSSVMLEGPTTHTSREDWPLMEEGVHQLIHEEVAAAVATALACSPSGPSELSVGYLHTY